MPTQEDPVIESLRRLFEQHWLHCRHLEFERAGFTSIVAAIVVGVLTFMATSETITPYPIYFLIALTSVGLILTVRWTYAFEFHRTKTKDVALALGIKAEIDIPAKGIWKIFRTRIWFPTFYIIMLTGLVLFLVYTN